MKSSKLFYHKDSDIDECHQQQQTSSGPYFHTSSSSSVAAEQRHDYHALCGVALTVMLLMTQINLWVLVCVLESSPQALLWMNQLVPATPTTWMGVTTRTNSSPASFAQDNHEQLQRLIHADSMLSWTKTTDEFFQELNLTAVLTPEVLPSLVKLHGRPKGEKIKAWRNTQKYYYVWEANLCFAARNFLKAGGVKPHVLFTYLNENRGAFSMDVRNRTVEWDHLATHWTKWGCTDEEIFTYLDHPNTKAVFTTQHQSYAHPKVHSIPLGASPVVFDKLLSAIQLPPKERTQLLMINDNGWKFRAQVTQTVTGNFARDRPDMPPLQNTYSKEPGSGAKYVEELRISKFILAPSGLGWDCYRIWEALYMGVIPIIERYDRPEDAWRETLRDLPVLWVNHLEDVTPDLLEKEYIQIAANQYNYKKLTKQWWIDYFRSFFADELALLEHTTANTAETTQKPLAATRAIASNLLRLYSKDPNEIPRILHFVYVTPGLPEDQPALPVTVQNRITEWSRLHPDWMVILWDNTAFRREFPDLFELVKHIKTMSWISNLLRYHALEKYGGVYLDVDIVPIRSIEPLRSRFTNFAACEQPQSDGPRQSESNYTVTYCEIVNNNVIGVPPHHPAMRDVIQLAVKNTKLRLYHFPDSGGPYELVTTGPPVWSKSVKKFGLNILHPSLFYPCHWDHKDHCRLELWKDQSHVYGMHEWTMSWLSKKPAGTYPTLDD